MGRQIYTKACLSSVKKKKKKGKADGVTQVPSKHEALSSNPSTTHTEKISLSTLSSGLAWDNGILPLFNDYVTITY
jgi:hypothetical protein